MSDEFPLVFEHENIRFTCSNMGDTHDGRYVINATRISDGRHLHQYVKQAFISDQKILDSGLSAQEFFEQACQARMLEALGNFEPEPTLCYACESPLEADDDTDYQFDNALWINFTGGYGMFVDDIDKFHYGSKPKFRVVICHSCAHQLCDTVPWISRLIEPLSSHSHRVDKIPELLAEGHQGWDLDRIGGEENGS